MLTGLPRLGKLRKLKSHKAPSQGFKSSNNCWERGLSSQPSKQQVVQQGGGEMEDSFHPRVGVYDEPTTLP